MREENAAAVSRMDFKRYKHRGEAILNGLQNTGQVDLPIPVFNQWAEYLFANIGPGDALSVERMPHSFYVKLY